MSHNDTDDYLAWRREQPMQVAERQLQGAIAVLVGLFCVALLLWGLFVKPVGAPVDGYSYTPSPVGDRYAP